MFVRSGLSVKTRFILLSALLGAFACAGWAAERSDEAKTWAFHRPQRPAAPAVRDASWIRNPVDAFILARLEAAGLRPAPEAAREILIRRLSFDLTGLPPTPEETAVFVHDTAPDAYEKLVDRLLASPRYGERWALYWLDLVRYAESDGFKADDPRPTAWRYRDYVIHSLNSDKPYDRFVQEQLAGDELFPNDDDALLATGFYRHFGYEYNQVNLELRRQEVLNDMTDTTAQVFLGLTVGCARCHDHKFDPITQKDYYRLQAFFAAYQPIEANLGTPKEKERHAQQLAQWEAKTEAVRRDLAALEEPHRQKFMASRKTRFSGEYQAMYETPPAQRSPLQAQLAHLVALQVEAADTKTLVKGMKGDVLKQWQGLSKQLSAFAGLKPPELPAGPAMTDVGPVAPPTYLLKRGDVRLKGKEVEPGFLSAIDEKAPAVPTPELHAKTTGRRAALARWLTESDHPLTARVLVNRLWQHHFGRGLVATPSDFGAQGEVPTHPELLDWLACELPARGWSLKALHRLMVTSAAYRQSSDSAEHGARSAEQSVAPHSALRAPRWDDPDNKLLSHMNRRRLEGEALRDAMLAAAGLLNRQEEGPSVYPPLPAELRLTKEAWPVETDATVGQRRSVYVFVKRNLRYPLFSIFDAPDSNETCARRNLSLNAPQALVLLNDPVVLEHARAFAGRVIGETGAQVAPLIERIYRLALGRSPQPDEVQACVQFLQAQAEALRARAGKTPPSLPAPLPAGLEAAQAAAVVDLCHVVFNLNEFLYVD